MLLQQIHTSDIAAIDRYNATAKEEFKLRTEFGPCPFEGDIHAAPIVLLLANPGFDESSSLEDHKFKAFGWPLAGLHPNAPRGMRDWWVPRLRLLCERYGRQYIATKVAALQLNPWASKKFDANLRLPSRSMMIGIAESAAKRGAILIVIRAARHWNESSVIRAYPRKYATNHPICSYVSEGNLSNSIGAWTSINEALAAS